MSPTLIKKLSNKTRLLLKFVWPESFARKYRRMTSARQVAIIVLPITIKYEVTIITQSRSFFFGRKNANPICII